MTRGLALAIGILLGFPTVAAGITFSSPLPNAQAFGPTALEVQIEGSVDRVDFFVDGALAGVARKSPFRVVFDFGSSLSSRTITARAWSGGFTTSESASITTAAQTVSDTLHVELVEVLVRARASRPLQPADLRVRENGIDQSVRSVQAQRPPAHFAFIVDRSLSMHEGKLAASLQAIEQQLHQLRSGDTASLVVFNHQVARPREIVAGQSLRSLQLVPSGGTSLRDALASVASRERTYAIVITDGGDRSSLLTDQEALRAISRTKTVVNAIVLGNEHTRFLDQAATNTGGAVLAATKTSVAGTLSSILSDINGRYLVVYQSNATSRGWRKVEVTARRSHIGLTRASKGYYAQ